MRKFSVLYPVCYAVVILASILLLIRILPYKKRSRLGSSIPASFEVMEPQKLRVDPYRYNWTLLEKDFCTKYHPHTRYLIIMHTATENFENRRAYRNIYGDKYFRKQGVRLLFTLGHSKNSLVEQLVKNESAHHHDIIQQNFLDTYRNLTWKAIMSLRFVSHYCHYVRYVISTDDDVIINLWELLRILKIYPYTGKPKKEVEKTIFCKMLYHQKVLRNPLHKWYQSRIEFPADYYKDYCAALAIILPGKLIPKLLEASKNETFHRVIFPDEKTFNLDGLDVFYGYWHYLRKEGLYFPNELLGAGRYGLGRLLLEWQASPNVHDFKDVQHEYTEIVSKSLLPFCLLIAEESILARKVGVKFKDFSRKAYNHVHKKDRQAFLRRKIYFQATETIQQTKEIWEELKRIYDLRQRRYFERQKEARYREYGYPEERRHEMTAEHRHDLAVLPFPANGGHWTHLRHKNGSITYVKH